MKNYQKIFAAIAFCLFLSAAVSAQTGGDYAVRKGTIASGGGRSIDEENNTYGLGGTTGQPIVGAPAAGGQFGVQSGFWGGLVAAVSRVRADFDGDGRTDLSVFRPAEGTWYLNRSTAGLVAQNFGLNGDIPVPGDFDNDGKTDIAVFRGATDPLLADFHVLRSQTSTFTSASWGLPGDIPQSGDFDGDGKTDYAVFRPADSTWYVLRSGGGLQTDAFGSAGDIPMVMDYEADGRANYAVFRPSNGLWYIAKPTGVPAQNFHAIPFGLATDTPVPADYDNDSKDDIAMFRAATGVWYVLRSSDGVVTTTSFGLNGDVPVPGDYDGDGADDIAVFRNGTWHLNRSTAGLVQFNFGMTSDTPIPKKYIP